MEQQNNLIAFPQNARCFRCNDRGLVFAIKSFYDIETEYIFRCMCKAGVSVKSSFPTYPIWNNKLYEIYDIKFVHRRNRRRA